LTNDGQTGSHVPATLRDVARVARVHLSTVSRAMNAETRSLVNADTLIRVLNAAEQLDYRPNQTARALRMKRSLSVGVIVPDLLNPMVAQMIGGIEARLGEAGYLVLLGNADHSDERAKLFLETMSAHQVEGIISTAATEDDEALREVGRFGRPLVLANRSMTGGIFSSVVPDDQQCSELAIDHLVGLGHQRIGHIAGPPTVSNGLLRRRGYESALARRGIAVRNERVQAAVRYTVEEGERACEKLFARCNDLTAIFAGNDLLAIGCLDALARRSLRCPEDISIVGCNDMPFSGRFDPPLTTVHVPLAELGEIAADLLLELIADHRREPRHVVVDPYLVVRGSTAPAKG
jgi:LacI family transcriptional regulator